MWIQVQQTLTLFPELWLAFLHCGHDHVTHTSGGEPVQTTLDAFDRYDVQVLCHLSERKSHRSAEVNNWANTNSLVYSVIFLCLKLVRHTGLLTLSWAIKNKLNICSITDWDLTAHGDCHLTQQQWDLLFLHWRLTSHRADKASALRRITSTNTGRSHTCVVSTVDDRSHWETQWNTELGSDDPPRPKQEDESIEFTTAG